MSFAWLAMLAVESLEKPGTYQLLLGPSQNDRAGGY
jgi:hypothetical protein